MFERTRRKVAFTEEERRFAVYSLTWYHNNLVSREGFTDRVDDIMSRIASKPAGRKVTFTNVEFEVLMIALTNWQKGAKLDPNMPYDRITDFILQIAETPDMTGKKYWTPEKEAR